MITNYPADFNCIILISIVGLIIVTVERDPPPQSTCNYIFNDLYTTVHGPLIILHALRCDSAV